MMYFFSPCGERQSLCRAAVNGRVRTSQRVLVGALMALFAASMAVTIMWCTSMSAMGAMPMPGGWSMSMAWMRMPGQTWSGAAASFLGMWIAMMVAMMLPSLLPMLYRYRQDVGDGGAARLVALTVLVGTAYFLVWTALGIVTFPVGVMLNALAMQEPGFARAVPLTTGVVVLIAGALQLTRWKSHYLSCCRGIARQGHRLHADARTAWRYGLRLGLECVLCCAPLMAILLVVGAMDLGVMAAVTAAITIERLARAGERVARVTGAVAIGAGVALIARAVGV